MRKTRFMSLFFLVLGLAFFFVSEFRQALQVPAVRRQLEMGVFKVGPAALVRDAEQEGDARTLAFVALNSPDQEERARLAGQAVSLDPSLTWIYYWLATRNPRPAQAREWTDQLQAWDPENAIPYLLEAELLREERKDDWPGWGELDAWAEETEWRQAMEKAFAAPRYDSYINRWFELQRSLLREQEWDDPLSMIAGLAGYPIPSLLNVLAYGNLQVDKLGKEAEEAGRLREAEQHYWAVAHFGERMQLGGRSFIDQAIALAQRIKAYEALAPLLRRTGREDEAASLEHATERLEQVKARWRGKDPLTHSSHYDWSALMVYISAGLVVIFGGLTLVSLLYVNAKRWIRREKKGRVYQLFTILENYAPVLFFVACLALYVAYYPYARNYEYYMTASGEIYNFEPFIFNSFPLYGLSPFAEYLPLENPFQPYIWYALGGVALVVVLMLVSRRRA